MKLIMENWQGYLAEAEDEAKLTQIMDQALAHLIDSLDQIVPEASQEEEIDEAAVMAAAGLALAAPHIIKILGETINWIASKIKKLMGTEDPSEGTAWGNKLLEISEKLHDKYLSPLTFVSRKLFPDKDEEWHHKVGGRIFHLIVAAFLIYSGYAAFQAFKATLAGGGAKAISVGLLESAVAAVKSDELWEFLIQVGH